MVAADYTVDSTLSLVVLKTRASSVETESHQSAFVPYSVIFSTF